MVKQVLFLCPHNAAKSVMATAYFNKRVGDLGIEARGFSAGTEPDEEVSPHVVALLAREGYSNPAYKPRKVSRVDVENADQIVSIGCSVSDLPFTAQNTAQNIVQWDDISPPSQDLNGAWRQLKERVDRLIEQMYP